MIVDAVFARISRGRAKPIVAWLLRRPPGSWLLRVAQRLLPTRQPVGVLAVVLDDARRVLLIDHVTRYPHPLGLPGGWLDRAERPEDGLRRELQEELGLQMLDARYLLSAPHGNGTGRPYGLTLVYRVAVAPGEPTRTSAEVLDVLWLDVDEATMRLRDFEADAVRLALRE